MNLRLRLLRLEHLELHQPPEPISPLPDRPLVPFVREAEAAGCALLEGRFAEWAADQPREVLAYVLFVNWLYLDMVEPYGGKVAIWQHWRTGYVNYSRQRLLTECVRTATLIWEDSDDEDEPEEQLPYGLKQLPNHADGAGGCDER